VNEAVENGKLKAESAGKNAPVLRPKTFHSQLSTFNSVSACMATAVELERTRDLISALEDESRALNERLETEKHLTVTLTELNETRKSENAALQSVIAAKNETIAAQDKVIASQDKLVTALKNRKRSPLSRIGDILIGAAVFAVLK
jgi:hypothetical protein